MSDAAFGFAKFFVFFALAFGFLLWQLRSINREIAARGDKKDSNEATTDDAD